MLDANLHAYYVHDCGTFVVAELAESFKLRGGLDEPWGKQWRLVYATSIPHAKDKAELLKLKHIW